MVVDGREKQFSGRVSSLVPRFSTGSPPICRSPSMRSRDRCYAWLGAPTTPQRGHPECQPLWQRGCYLHPRWRRCPALLPRSRGRHVGAQRAHPGAHRDLLLGGWKDSLFGDTHMYGPQGIHFFTRSKVVTSRWPEQDGPTLGVNLNFPAN